ncbi:GNAT family N-acetyltransferase [Paenibacillus sp. ACRSA]|uniref:GNAT family N-acetyltransferase n=1 Tax=Paenibacillus sp. ACRSA TaxID=2918211 RepID=UPI001EF6D86A|nr:GNAT family N-acetyltransferase [Paenibacillus sp. ACRSA]MCG7376389.1 GNAT family N-acetyltransferase [Paenibacillus sp. ACRSA]
MSKMQDLTISIVEYEPRYARSIADMWNASSESWGGDNSLQTEQAILQEHHHSTHLHVFLALVGEEVVGYCSFSHYKEDQGALYIPLLNVRPDYHGYKIGKRLVLRAIEQTLKLGYPRLDLYTWPGNIKAVPTYKKSGFFWEKRDDTTHLMNLIPSVLQTDAVRSYFEQLDWYADSVREILVEPDGRQERGFDYFTYEWRKADINLKMEYERTGRGLRLIETDDYLIQATIPHEHKLPFGATYHILYEAVNKSGKPLTIEVKGISNTDIHFNLQEVRSIDVEERIEGSFLIYPIQEEQDAFQTHPVVEAQVLINGRAATFKLGIEPKFPVKVKAYAPEQSLYIGDTIELDFTIENEYDEDTVFAFQLPSDDVLSFSQPDVQIQVPAKSRRTVSVAAELLSYGIWHHHFDVYQVLGEERSLILSQESSLVFPGIQSAFGGETEQNWVIANGRYSVHLNKINNNISIYEGKESTFHLNFPQLGLPYVTEFKKTRATRVTYRQEQGMVLEAEYDLASSAVTLVQVIQLYSNGTISRHHIVENKSKTARDEPLFLKEGFHFGFGISVIPYEDQYVDVRQGPDASNADYWQLDNVTENWIFTDVGESTRGITWPKDLKLIVDGRSFGVEHELHDLPAGGRIETKPLHIALGTWKNWRDFRAFAQSHEATEELASIPQLQTKVNQGNPFLHGKLEVEITEQKNAFLEGEITLSTEKGSALIQKQRVSIDQALNRIVTPMSWQYGQEADLMSLHLNMETYEIARSRLIFPGSKQRINHQLHQTEHGDVLTVSNGILQFQASNTFAPALFSLKYHGVEWLDTSYPEPGPKSWWNPWLGGISSEIQGLSATSLLGEAREASFIELEDNLGNVWSGIRMSITIQENAKLRGLVIHYYYVTLPGVPVLATTTRIEQNTGVPQQPFIHATQSFYRASNELTDMRIYVKNDAGEPITYKAGRVQYGIDVTSGIIQYGSPERKERLTFVAHPEMDGVYLRVNNHIASSVVVEELELRDGEQHFSKPQFYIISDQRAPEEAYQDLRHVRFDPMRGERIIP